MIRKSIFILLFAIFTSMGAFAQWSAGTGDFFNIGFGGGYNANIPGMIMGSLEMPFTNFGAYGFIDGRYVEFSFGVSVGLIELKYNFPVYGNTSLIGSVDYSFFTLNLGILGKIPFKLNEKLKLFPAFGFEYEVTVFMMNEEGIIENYSDFSALWFRLGAGLDISLHRKIYLRATILYGIRLPNEYENAEFKEGNIFLPNSMEYNISHGPSFKFAIGFMF